MTTHIFVASGMWDDVVSQNEVAAGLTSWGPGHYTSWLTYGLLQAGRYEEAARRLNAARELAAPRGTAGARSYLAFMRAYHVINTERWRDPSLEWTIALQDGWPRARVADLFLSGYAAFKRGEIERGQKALRDLGQLVQRLGDDPVMQVLASELEAVAALRAGDHAKAVRLMERATAIEDSMPAEYGPPDIVKPSHELYGELLMALDRPVDAQRQFELALMLAPKRARTLVGLIHAARAAGDTRAVERARAALDQAWHAADPELVAPRNHRGGN
jgi:tetratricopeptide (TPR) repeat protein